jgi:hypothetical protein
LGAASMALVPWLSDSEGNQLWYFSLCFAIVSLFLEWHCEPGELWIFDLGSSLSSWREGALYVTKA